jgi:ubiquinone/menaquinone biosynthesis C-methylase UbiE
MDEEKIAKIKAAVRRNFEESPEKYQAFEDRYGFFGNLIRILLTGMRFAIGAKILDVGCGTGSSSVRIAETISDCTVWGLDNSSAMLDKARLRFSDVPRLHFVEGDAARLNEYFDFAFDAIIYSASIFLIPDYQASLRQARDLLTRGGSVALTFMDGLYDVQGRNAFAVADREAKEGVSLKRPVKLNEFHSFFKTIFPVERSWQEDFRMPDELLKDFFSVPAMSAGLFPGVQYSERVAKVQRLFDYFPKTESFFRWMFIVGEL